MLHKLRLILTKHEKKNLIVMSLGLLILSLFETFSIGIIIPIMGIFVNPEMIQTSPTLLWLYRLSGAHDNISFLSILIVIAIILFVVKSIYSVFMLYKQNSFIGVIGNRIKTEVLQSYLNKPYSFHLQNNSSKLFKNISASVAQFISGFLTPIMVIFSEIIIFLGIFSLLIFAYPFITFLLICVFGSVLILLNYFLKNKIQSYSMHREIYSEQIYKAALEALNAIKEIQVYNVRSFFIERFEHAVRKYTNGFVKFTVVSGLPRFLLETILFASVLITLLMSLYFGKAPSELIPMISVIGVASLRILPSVYKIYNNFNLFQYSSNCLDIVYDILQETILKEIQEQPLPGKLLRVKDVPIRLKNITFCYKAAPFPIFESINLTIPAHQTIAFVGESGAGKSTLIDILMGLLTPSKGALYYGHVAINSGNVSDYRKKIGYVPQEIFLSDDNLEANIAFGIPQDRIDHKQLENVIQISQLESLIGGLPEGVKTPVGERGVKLSGGQRQRIGIARALYHNPEILILDEATSALDGHTEAEISEAIKKLRGNITIILIAHRLTTVEYTDIIYVMDRGKIVDQGTFRELMRNSATFQKIANQKNFFNGQCVKSR